MSLTPGLVAPSLHKFRLNERARQASVDRKLVPNGNHETVSLPLPTVLPAVKRAGRHSR